MRYLHDDAAYFRFLDGLTDDAPPVAAMKLACEFPTLRNEEAKAVYCDWLLARKPQTISEPASAIPDVCYYRFGAQASHGFYPESG